MLQTGVQLGQMFRLGWLIVNDNAAISALAFAIELESTTPFDRDDWTLGSKALVELGYLPDGYSWVYQRTWMTSISTEIGTNIRPMLEGYFLRSPGIQLVVLTDQRDSLQTRWNQINNAVVNELDPWLISPPVGTDAIIIQAVQLSYNQAMKELSKLDIMISKLDEQIGELTP